MSELVYVKGEGWVYVKVPQTIVNVSPGDLLPGDVIIQSFKDGRAQWGGRYLVTGEEFPADFGNYTGCYSFDFWQDYCPMHVGGTWTFDVERP